MVKYLKSRIDGFFFVFKKKTASKLRISDWSSDVCSSDLGEGVELDAHHGDAERRGGALVGAHGDQATPGPRPTQVGHQQREQHEGDEAHERPGMGVVEGVDLDAEELHPPDPRATVEGLAQVVLVREHDL